MKERSKNAARFRREKENAEFAQLAKLLPLPSSITAQLDKASIIRLTSSYLRLRNLFPRGLGGEWGEDLSSSEGVLKEVSSHLFQALDGFVLVLTADGKITYVSETASVQLGLSQVEMTGNSIYDYIHNEDCDEMKLLLTYQETVLPLQFLNKDTEVPKRFCIRMKCILAKRNAGLATDGYKAIHYNGYLKLTSLSPDQSTTASFHRQVVGLVAVGHSLPSSAVTEIKMSNNTFMFRAGLDFTLIYLDMRVLALTGYEPHHLVDKTLYKFVHHEDCQKLREDHVILLTKGQVTTNYYRLLTRTGGWVWIHSVCTVIHNNRASRQRCILAVNQVLSEREYAETLLATEQMQALRTVNINPNNVPPAKRPRVSPANDEELDSSLAHFNLIQNHVHRSNLLAEQTTTAFQASYNTSQNEASFHAPVYFNGHQKDLESDLLDFERIKKKVDETHSNRLTVSDHVHVFHKYEPPYPFYGNNTIPCGLNPSRVTNCESNSNGNESSCTSKLTVNSKPDVPYLYSGLNSSRVTNSESNSNGNESSCTSKLTVNSKPDVPYLYSGLNSSLVTNCESNGNESICTSKLTVNSKPDVPCLYSGLNSSRVMNCESNSNGNANISTSELTVNSKPYVPQQVLPYTYYDLQSIVHSPEPDGKCIDSHSFNLDEDFELPYYVERINNSSNLAQNNGENYKNYAGFLSTDKSFLQNSDLNCNSFPPEVSFQTDLHSFAENYKNTISADDRLQSDQYFYQSFNTEGDCKPKQPFLSTLTQSNLGLTSGGSYYDCNSNPTANYYLSTMNNYTISGPTHAEVQKFVQPIDYNNEKQESISTRPNCAIDAALTIEKPDMSSLPFSVCNLLPNWGSPISSYSETSALSDQNLDKKCILYSSPSDYSSGFSENICHYDLSSPAMSYSCDAKYRTSSDSVKRKVEALELQSLPCVANKTLYTIL